MSSNTTLSVHSSRKIFVANDNVRGLLAIYEYEPADKPGTAKRTFFKTLDPSIKVGDYLTVPSTTRHHMTTVKVVDVDVECDLADQTPVDWVIGKIDRRAYEQVVTNEGEMLNMIRSAEKKKMRADLKAAVFADVPEDQVKTLAIASMGGEGLIEGKKE